jgi:hypothetical protein
VGEVGPAVPRWRKVLAAVIAAATVVALVLRPGLAIWTWWGLVAAAALLTTDDPRRPRRGPRHARAERWAARHGWTYTMLDRELALGWAGPPFDSGVGHVCREVLRRDADGLVSATVRWRRRRASTREPDLRHAHLVSVPLPVPLPLLALRPHAAESGSERFGPDIVTESPDFNATWRVLARDSRYAYEVLHPGLLARLVADDLGDAAGVCVDGPVLRVWWPGFTDLDRVEARAAVVADLAARIPRHVWREHAGAPGPRP